MNIKKPQPLTCEDAVTCIFNLNRLDISVLNKLRELGPIRADEIALNLNRERSTVYRSLQKLKKCGICIKKTKTLPHGGYYHVYELCNTTVLRHEAERCLDEWYYSLKKTLKQLS